MNAVEALRTRRSIRTYADRPVERAVMEEIVDCARLAPTAMNDQPWEFVVITERAALESIPPLLGHAAYIGKAAFAVLVLGKPTNANGSPAGYVVEDCSAATENLLVAAWAHGIGSCWVAGTKQPYGPAVVKAFGGPADHKLIAIVSFGYPAETVEIEKRKLEDVLHWERY